MDAKWLHPEKIDNIIRFFLYLLIILLPISNSGIEICFGLILILWIVKHLLLRSVKVEPSALNTPIYIFVCIGILSVIWSSNFKVSLHAFFSKFMEGILLYFFMIETLKQKKHLSIIIALFLLVAVVVSIDGIVQYFFTGIDIFRQRPIVREGVTASFEYPNKFAAYLFFPLFITLGMLMDKLKVRKIDLKLFGLFCMLGLLFFTFILTKSRGALLGLIVAVPFFAFYINRKVFLVTAVVAAIIISTLAFLIVTDSSLKIFRLEPVRIRDTAIIRTHIWRDTLNMIKERPVFGHGINTYMRLFQKYRSDPSQYPTYAHNCYLQIAAEMGLAGLIVFLWIVGRFFRNSVNKKTGYVLLGVAAGMFAFLVHSFFDTNLYSLQLNILFWFMLGLAVAKTKIG